MIAPGAYDASVRSKEKVLIHMCYAGNCNPICDKCSPKKLVQIACPHCGTTNQVEREEYLLHFGLPHRLNMIERKMKERGFTCDMSCSMCGKDLEEVYAAAVEPRVCKRIGIICGYPCGRSSEEPTENNRTCNTMVPLGKAPQSDG